MFIFQVEATGMAKQKAAYSYFQDLFSKDPSGAMKYMPATPAEAKQVLNQISRLKFPSVSGSKEEPKLPKPPIQVFSDDMASLLAPFAKQQAFTKEDQVAIFNIFYSQSLKLASFAPKAADDFMAPSFDAVFGQQMRQMIDLFYTLDGYTKFDDLTTFRQKADQIASVYSDIDKGINDRPAAEQDAYRARLKQNLAYLGQTLSGYLKGGISSDGSFNTAQDGAFFNKVTSIQNTVIKMNELDALLNIYMTGAGKDVSKQRTEIKNKVDELKNEPALGTMLALRYGSKGEAFEPAYSLLGITKNGATLEQQYVNLLRGMADLYPADYKNAIMTFETTYNSAYQALLVMPKITVASIEGSTTRDAFDPFSRLALFNTAGTKPNPISSDELALMIIAAKDMPVSTQGLLFGNSRFISYLATFTDKSLRTAVFNRAVLGISSVYSQSLLEGDGKAIKRVNYENATTLSEKYASLPSQANLVSTIRARNFAVSQQGSIAIRMPYEQMVNIDQLYIVSNAVQTFSNTMMWPVSLFGTTEIPYVQKRGTLQRPDLQQRFDYKLGDRRRSLAATPIQTVPRYTYTLNVIERETIYENIVGKMDEAEAAILSKNLSNLKATTMSITGLGGTNTNGVTGDVQVYLQGLRPGQRASLEVYGNSNKEKAGTVFQPEAGKSSSEIFAEAQASQMRVLGQNVRDALFTFSQTTQRNPATQKDPATNQMDEYFNGYLSSTFPLARDGTTMAFVNQKKSVTETKNADGSSKEEGKADYIIDVYMKKGDRWDHFVTTDDSRYLLDQPVGGGGEKLRDAVDHYFNELYSGLGKRAAIDAGFEINTYKYGKTPSGQEGWPDVSYGAMLILQPGSNFAFGAGKTTTEDYALLFGYDNRKAGTAGKLAYGGFYAFNPDVMPKIGAYGLTYGGGQGYYAQSYKLDEKAPVISSDKTFMLSGTLMGVESYRATVFGGWKTNGESALLGEDFRLKNANVSCFFNYDFKNGLLNGGVINVGGRRQNLKIGKLELPDVSATMNIVKPETNDPGQMNVILSAKTKKGGQFTLLANVREGLFANNLPQSRLDYLFGRCDALALQIDNINPASLANLKTREITIRGIGRQYGDLLRDFVEYKLSDDPAQATPVNAAVAYSAPPRKDGKPASSYMLTLSLTDDKGYMATGLANFRDRWALLGGFQIGGDETKSSYDWVGGVMLKPTDKLKFTFFAYQADTSVRGKAEAIFGDMADISVAGGDSFYQVSASVGKENFMTIVNLGNLKGINYGQLGFRSRTGIVTFAAAYGLIWAANSSQVKNIAKSSSIIDKADIKSAAIPAFTDDQLKQLSIKGIFVHQASFDMTIQVSPKVDFNATGQMFYSNIKSGVGLGGTPEFYIGIGTTIKLK